MIKMKVHKSLEECINDKFVVRDGIEYEVSNKYWRWCKTHSKPFVAITVPSPRSRYVTVELDLYNTTDDGFNAKAGYEILHTILGMPMKPKSEFFVSPVLIDACVAIPSARPLADFLYQSAIDEGIIHTQKELIDRVMTRDKKGLPAKSAFKGFSADVHPKILAQLHTSEFWLEQTAT
jgi:hypothetical protein